MMRKAFAPVVAICLFVASMAPAVAGHGHPPRAILKAPHTWQKGALGTYCWSYSNRGSNEGTGECVDTVGYGWPDPDTSDVAAQAKIRFWAPKLPREVVLEQWRATNADGEPVGPSSDVPVVLRPHRKDGEIVAYDARFRLPDTPGDVYLRAFAVWGSIQYPHGPASGDATYDFHVVVE